MPKRGPYRATIPNAVRPLVLLLLLLACATPIIYRRVVQPPEPISSKLEPVFARRDHCLEPPWWIADAGVIAVGNGPRATISELQAFGLEAWVATGALAWGSVRASPDGGAAQHVALSLCRLRREEIVALGEKQAAELGRSFDLELELVGARGPRCESDDPACGPTPYLPARAEYRPDRPRILIYPFSRDAGAECRWDGECSGGQGCRPWNTDVFIETLELRTAQQDAFCGCVEQRCQWFDQ